MSSGYIGISVDEPPYLRIVIAGLEIVERGFNVLGLSARPIYTQSVSTRNRMDFVWVFLWVYIALQFTDKLPNVDLGAVRQHVAIVSLVMALPL